MSKCTGFPNTVPVESIQYLIGVLTGSKPVDYREAVMHAYLVVGYLADNLLSLRSETKPGWQVRGLGALLLGKKKKLCQALEALLPENQDSAAPQAVSIPPWLVPILLHLISKWLEKYITRD